MPAPPSSRICRVLAGLALAGAGVGAASQAAYPSGPVRLIVPFPAAGGTDVVARLIAAKITTGTPAWNFVIDNRPGAGGNIGLDAVAKAKPDGATFGMGQTANLAINPALYPTMPYQALKDFVPVAVVAAQPVVLVVRADAPYKTLAELIAAAKAKPGALTMASAGNGTVGHLVGELLRKQAAIDFVHVPYKGAGPASTDLLGGQVNFYFATPQAAVPLIKAGKLRALAVTSAERVQVLPDVATAREAGLPGLQAVDWKMLVAPAGTPAAIVRQLNAEAEKALARPDTLAALLSEGSSPMHGDPAQAAAFAKSEYERWGKLVRDAHVKLD